MVTTIHYRLQEQSQIVNSTNINAIKFRFLGNKLHLEKRCCYLKVRFKFFRQRRTLKFRLSTRSTIAYYCHMLLLLVTVNIISQVVKNIHGVNTRNVTDFKEVD
jgi:hypothetical protein